MMNSLFRSIVAACLGTAFLSGAASASPDVPEARVSLLVPGGPLAGGARDVGVAFALPDGWHTYWRQPGDAGLPPVFDTSKSRNLAAFEIAWPAPERYLDGDIVSVVYHDDPVLPVRIVPEDPAAPIDLVVDMTFGYCRDVCVPGSASLSATIEPVAPVDAGAAAKVRAARAAVPLPEAKAPVDFPTVSVIERYGDDRKTAFLRITVTGGDPDRVDLFAEPPDGWYLAMPRRIGTEAEGAVFELPLRGMPRGAAFTGARFRFTVVTPDGALEAERTLD